MVNITTTKEKLYDFVAGQSGVEAIWAQQSGTQPDKTYITMKMNSFVRVGVDYYGRPDAAGDNAITGNREFTLSLQSYGPGGIEALELVRMGANKPTVREALAVGGIVFVDSLGITNLTGLEDTKFLERQAMDLLFRIAQESTDAPGKIEIVKDAEADYLLDGIEQERTFTVDTTV